MNKLIVTDPGHGESDSGAVGNELQEKDITLSICKFCNEYLAERGANVIATRETDKYIGINERAEFANKKQAALFVSIHINAGGGDGVEVIYSKVGGTSKELARNVVDCINNFTGQNKRPREIYTKTGSDGKDYFGVIRQTNMPAVIVECAFIDSKDVEIIDTSEERKLMGEAIAKGILKTLGIEDRQEEVKGTPIIASKTAELGQCKEWARLKKASKDFSENLPIYFEECNKVGVNPIVAVCQYAKETGYGKFGGVLNESYRNPCGLKETSSGKDDCQIAEAHKKFSTWRDGINAHIDHLALYAGVDTYPRKETLDPRHFPYLKGKCKTVEQLGGNWCPDEAYGKDLVKMMKEIEKLKVEEKDELKEAANVLYTAKIINTLEAWEKESSINIKYVPQLIINMAKYIKG